MPRKEEKPSIGKKLGEWVMTAGVMVLIGGLVCSFLLVGVYFVHASLSRNDDANMAYGETIARAPSKSADSPLEELKKPLPKAAPVPDPKSISVAPPPAAPKVPAVALPPPKPNPPSRDPSRMDNDGFIRYWLILAPIPAEKEMSGGVEIVNDRLKDESRIRPREGERVQVRGRDLAWKKHKTSDYFIDFKKLAEGKSGDDALGYAVAYVFCDEELKDLKLCVGSNDQTKVYVNGKAVIQHEKSRTMERDQSIVDGVALRKGENVIVFKVANERNLWTGCLRFMDRSNQPIRHLIISSTPQ